MTDHRADPTSFNIVRLECKMCLTDLLTHTRDAAGTYWTRIPFKSNCHPVGEIFVDNVWFISISASFLCSSYKNFSPLRRHPLGSSRNLPPPRCVTSPKSVCVVGYKNVTLEYWIVVLTKNTLLWLCLTCKRALTRSLIGLLVIASSNSLKYMEN